MFRTLLSIVALSAFALAQPCPAAAAQTPPPRSDGQGRRRLPPSTSIRRRSRTWNMLPGIGAKTAALIIEYRQKNGPFKKIEELMNVRGIGEKSFLKLKPQLTVAPAKAGSSNRDVPAESPLTTVRSCDGRTVRNHRGQKHARPRQAFQRSRQSRQASIPAGLLTAGAVVRHLCDGNCRWHRCAATLRSARRVPGGGGRTVSLDTDSTDPDGSGEPVDECGDAIRRSQATGYSYGVYVDGNGDGVRTQDITMAIDARSAPSSACRTISPASTLDSCPGCRPWILAARRRAPIPSSWEAATCCPIPPPARHRRAACISAAAARPNTSFASSATPGEPAF